VADEPPWIPVARQEIHRLRVRAVDDGVISIVSPNGHRVGVERDLVLRRQLDDAQLELGLRLLGTEQHGLADGVLEPVERHIRRPQLPRRIGDEPRDRELDDELEQVIESGGTSDPTACA
jgi:hypothetical protein